MGASRNTIFYMDSQNILDMAFLAEEYQTEYYDMELQTQYSMENNMPCMQKDCTKIQREYAVLREFSESKKLDIPQLDS